MTSEVTLREYRSGDVAAMYALDVECFQKPFRFSRTAMCGFAEAPGAVTVLAEAEGRLVGFSIVQMEQATGYVVTLDVAEDWRRQGLARRLMAEMESRVRDRNGEAIALHVFIGNDSAIRFYEAAGYRRLGAAQGFYGRGLEAWVYGKELAR